MVTHVIKVSSNHDIYTRQFLFCSGVVGDRVVPGIAATDFCGHRLFAARRHAQNTERINQAAPTKIATLTPSNQLVRLEGVIKQVPQPMDGPPELPLAVVRMKVEVYEQDEDSAG